MTRRTVAALALLVLASPRVNAQQVGLFKEDTAHVSGQYGFFGLAVRKDAAGTLCDADGDFCPFQVDATGQVRVVASQGGAPWSVTGSGTFTVAGTIVQGNAGSHAQRWMIGLSDGAGFISPATDRTTAAGPFSLRLSDGAAFYATNTAAQLPAALDGSGFLKVHEQGTATISGTVTANAGSNLNTSALALDATITGRLPAGSTPANGESNAATISRLGSFNFIFNGATWDRWTGAVTGTVTANQGTANATPWNENLAQVAGATVATAGTGIQKVGVVGNTGAAVDAANNAAAPANEIVQGDELQSGAQATAGTAGQVGRVVAGLDHVQYARLGGPVYWHCGLTAIAATLTQCKAATAAGLKAYVTDITVVSDTATAGSFTLRYGTGSNCATGVTTLFPDVAATTTGKIPYPANTANVPQYFSFLTPLQPAAATAVCVICVATNTCTISMQGYEAP